MNAVQFVAEYASFLAASMCLQIRDGGGTIFLRAERSHQSNQPGSGFSYIREWLYILNTCSLSLVVRATKPFDVERYVSNCYIRNSFF